MRKFSILIMIYMIAAIAWWGLLLFNKNEALYEARAQNIPQGEPAALLLLNEDHNRQSNMIIGEGAVLLLSMVAGLYIINRSVNKEISVINNQNNFLLSISHELKSPIAAIKLALQTIVKHDLKKEEKNKLINRAVDDSNRLEKMVENVLLTANIDNKSFELLIEPSNLTQIIKSYIDRKMLEPNVSIEFNQKQDVIIDADRNGIYLIISNLVDNAFKYATGNTPVIIELSSDHNSVIISVKDLGSGISAKDKAEIFKRFNRGANSLKMNNKGTGLGLYIVHNIVEAHNGSITVKDNVPMGSNFEITLPINA